MSKFELKVVGQGNKMFGCLNEAVAYIRANNISVPKQAKLVPRSQMECSAIAHNGRLLKPRFDNLIEASQYMHFMGMSNEQGYVAVRITKDGKINHHAIIQVIKCADHREILINHYTTSGDLHYPMSCYRNHIQSLKEAYPEPVYKIVHWKEY